MVTHIRHNLSLAVRLIDTTTGLDVVMRHPVFLAEGKPVSFKNKGNGFWILLGNSDRQDFQLEITSQGYEPVSADVCFDKLDKILPLMLLHLVPSKEHHWGAPLIGLEGQSSGLTSITGARPDDNSCLIRSFDARKRIITLFNPHKLSLDRQHYALVNPDNRTFEPFSIVKHIDDDNIKIDRVLETEFGNYFPITPVVFGIVNPEGDYRLHIRDNRTILRWLVRREQNGSVQFQDLDFRTLATSDTPM